MIVTVEISLYPLQADYESAIIQFIHHLRSVDSLTVQTTAMSTLVKGEFNVVMNTIQSGLEEVYDKVDTSSTVLKIINRDLPIEDGYLKL